MKVCHFSDSHLGAGGKHSRRGKSGLTVRQEDIINSFIEAIDRIIKIGPDLCIHSGDLFDSVRPLNRIIATAGRELHRLAEVNSIPTVIIGGNHDAPNQPHLGAAIEIYEQIANLYVAAGSALRTFDILNTKVTALPYCRTTSDLKEQLAACKPDPNARYNLFVAHGVAAGMPEFSMADLGEQEIPLDIIRQFDYAALGHYHNHKRVSDRAYYSGSTERLSQAERAAPKGFIEVELEPFRLTFHEVTTRQMVDMDPIDASGKRGDQLADIIRAKLEEVGSSDKIIRVKVRGVSAETMKTIPTSVIAALKQGSYDLKVQYERHEDEQSEIGFGRSAIGRLDSGFIEYLRSQNLQGFDRDRLEAEALKYLSCE
ncbi:MAG: exonuclease SbcCD subunit D [Candidatus Zixiibacteriota bacterium]|nr:MAG: exonuclease SbcCD subunit D [candidate division Zixibacteria bacterium]